MSSSLTSIHVFRGSEDLSSVKHVDSLLQQANPIHLLVGNEESSDLCELPKLNRIFDLRHLIQAVSFNRQGVTRSEASAVMVVLDKKILTSLTARNSKIRNLEWLRDSLLTVLDFHNSDVVNLMRIPAIHTLQTLDISFTPIRNLGGMFHFPNLQSLTISHNRISDLRPLVVLRQLRQTSLI
jgi:Leucine-rich repeat (LRR) protein